MKFVEIEDCSDKTIMPNGVHVFNGDTLLIGFTDETCAIVEAFADGEDGRLETDAWANDDRGRRNWLSNKSGSEGFMAAATAIGLATQADIDAAVVQRKADRKNAMEAVDKEELARLKAKYETGAAEVA